jgi:hypothetical protein
VVPHARATEAAPEESSRGFGLYPLAVDSIACPTLCKDDPDKIGCLDTHEDAGRWCERPAVMEVYGLFFCEVHGTEAKARCLEELYDDALQFLELFDARHVRMMNPEVLRIVRTGVGELPDWPEPDSAQALLAAYPVIPERVDLDISGVRLRLRGGL